MMFTTRHSRKTRFVDLAIALTLVRGNAVLASSSPVTLSKRARIVLRPTGSMPPGLYRVVATGRRPDGTALSKKVNVRKPRPPRRR